MTWAASFALACLASVWTILNVLQATGRTPPDPILDLLPALGIALALVGGLTALLLMAALTRRLLGYVPPFGVQWPIYRTDAPNPFQHLIDISEADAENPGRKMWAATSMIHDCHLVGPNPRIEFGIELHNGNVHAVLVGAAVGHLYFEGHELADPIRDRNEGLDRVQPGERTTLRIIQYLHRFTDDELETLRSQVATGAVTGFGFGQIHAPVRADSDGSPTSHCGLSDHLDCFRILRPMQERANSP